MIFNSVTYLLFLSAAVCLYWSLPRRPRLWMILLSSLVFYGFWRPEFVIVMVGSAVVDYIVALALDRTSRVAHRRWLLAASLTINLGLLVYFKYLYFIVGNAWAVLSWLGVEQAPPVLDIVLPLGISFYTFQTISYTIDVYRRHLKPERDFVLYACFVTYFPQLVAGPILRAGEVLYQLDTRPAFRLDTFTSGLRRILIGLFLKVVLADNIAPHVDAGFAQSLATLSALDVWTLAFLFGFQIYFDFSAYSHIAIGSARLMGIHLPENFNFPYMASSPREFWRRWHISLSSWIRDYLYLPLLGAKVHDRSTGGLAVAASAEQSSTRSPAVALFASWSIMGLWHGANWTFLLWGLYHACMITAYRAIREPVSRLPVTFQRAGLAITFPLMMLAWVPFRAPSVSDALTMFGKVLNPLEYASLGMRENSYLLAFVLTVGVLGAGWMHERLAKIAYRGRPYFAAAFDASLAIAATPLVFVFLRPINQFIYFQF